MSQETAPAFPPELCVTDRRGIERRKRQIPVALDRRTMKIVRTSATMQTPIEIQAPKNTGNIPQFAFRRAGRHGGFGAWLGLHRWSGQPGLSQPGRP